MSAITLFNDAPSVDLSYLSGITDTIYDKVSGGSVGKRISIRGGVFRMMAGGQEIAKSPDRHLDIVFVTANPNYSRTYYKGTYQEGVNVPPTCWSDAGIKPDDSVITKQSDTCMNCPMNIKGSGQGESKACRFSQRLAAVLPDNLEGDVYGLTLAATSIFGKGTDLTMPIKQYADYLKARKLPLNVVVTRMSFDLDSATPKLVFKPVQYLTAAQNAIVVAQAESAEAQEAIAPINYAGTRAPTTPALAAPVVEAPLFNQPVEAVVHPATEVIPEPVVRAKPAQAPEVGKTDIDQILQDWA